MHERGQSRWPRMAVPIERREEPRGIARSRELEREFREREGDFRCARPAGMRSQARPPKGSVGQRTRLPATATERLESDQFPGHQRLLLMRAPALELLLAANRGAGRRMSLRVNQRNRPPGCGVLRRRAGVVRQEALRDGVSVPDVEGVVRATKDVDGCHSDDTAIVGSTCARTLRPCHQRGPAGRDQTTAVGKVPFDSLRSLRTPLDSALRGLPRARPEGPSRVVRKGGFEPPRSCERQPLKLVRLPVPPLSLPYPVAAGSPQSGRSTPARTP
jgi:hypothetical protein